MCCRPHILEEIRTELGASETTEQVLDRLREAWTTIDTLRAQFGDERARAMVLASPAAATAESVATDASGHTEREFSLLHRLPLVPWP